MEFTKEEAYVLEQVLYSFNFICPIGHPEWYDLSERTKRSPQKTMLILDHIRFKLNEEVK